MSIADKSAIFSDLSSDFLLDKNGDVAIAINEAAVDQQVENILGISPGEVFMRPGWGAGLDAYIGRKLDEDTAVFMEMTTEAAFANHPYIGLSGISINPVSSENRYDITIGWYVRTANLHGDFTRSISPPGT